MSGTPDDPPEAQRFDEFFEAAVDGRPIARLENISDFKTSDVDDAILAVILRSVAESIEEDIQDEHDTTVEDLLGEVDVEVRTYDSDNGEWEGGTL
jgi:hypothetical protein